MRARRGRGKEEGEGRRGRERERCWYNILFFIQYYGMCVYFFTKVTATILVLVISYT